jgi:uncharacterized protein YciI
MPLFVLTCIDKPDSLALRQATREAHLAYLAGTGKARLGGPFLSPAGDPTGSLIIVEAEDEAEAEALSLGDPYRKAGLFERVEVRRWRIVAGQIV